MNPRIWEHDELPNAKSPNEKLLTPNSPNEKFPTTA